MFIVTLFFYNVISIFFTLEHKSLYFYSCQDWLYLPNYYYYRVGFFR